MIEAADLARRIVDAAGNRERFVVAIAGPPASGKSTLVDRLQQAVNAIAGEEVSAVFALDGYHFDDAVLAARGQQARKGASFTFDVAGYAAALARIRNGRDIVAVPVFDRRLELSRAAARLIEPRHRIVLTEGNYLLLDEAPWSALRPLFDMTVALDIEEAVLEARLMERWLGHGRTRDASLDWIRSNDLPNIRHVLRGSRAADVTLSPGRPPASDP